MSLLDFLNNDDAKLGLGLLAAGGPSTVPLSFGQRVQGAMQGLDAAKDSDMRRQYLRSQMDENTSQIDARRFQMQRDQTIQQVIVDRLRGAGGAPQGVAPVPQQPGMQQPGPLGSGVAPFPSGAQSFPVQPQGAAPGVAQGASRFPFNLADITMLQSAGYKGADTLFGMYKYANDGVKRDAGAYYVDPMTGEQKYFPKLGEGQTVSQDGTVSTARGYAASNASSKGLEAQAVESAKYPFAVSADRARQTTTAALDTQPVIGEDGNTYYTPRLSIAMGGAGPMVGAGGTSGPGGAGGGSGVPGGFMASRNPITQQSAIAINDNWLKNSYQPTIDAGKVANDLDANIQALRTVDIKTGWGTEAKASAASVLAGLGISKGNADMYASNAQKFQSIAMDKLMTTLQAQKGMQTEGDADRAKQTFVSLKNTPDANAFILDFAQAKTNMDKRRAQYYEQALPMAQKRGDLTEVNRRWNKLQPSLWDDPLLQKWAK